MFFSLLTFLSAFFIEGIGTYISILGLTALFASNPIIIAMAVALDVGKLVAVSFLYKYWKKINLLMKSYMTIASIVLVFITSMGAFGFLSAQFQKAIAGNNTQNIMISALEDEKSRLQTRKQEIDAQIANLPPNYVNSRVRLINQFKAETARINDRLAKIDEELPLLKVENIEKSVKIGPILYVAEAFQTTPEQAVKWVILVIIFVFDPLAIALILAGNYLWEQRRPKELTAQNEISALSSIVKLPENGAESVTEESKIDVIEHNTLPPADNEKIDISLPPIDETAINKTEEKNAGPVTAEPTVLPKVKQKSAKVAEPQPVPMSSLEKINANRGDVSIENDERHVRQISRLVHSYKNDLPHDGPVVSIGGPPTKIARNS